MIRTKSIYHDPREPADGYRLLVMRHWPRGVKKDQVDRWLKELGPSAELLASYRRGEMDWAAFAQRYIQQVAGTAPGRALLDCVRQLEAEHGTLTLLCHEDLSDPGAHCHREVLKDLLEGRGVRRTPPSPWRCG
jgi:uncharacterized protein YeaO (DUF488 family)